MANSRQLPLELKVRGKLPFNEMHVLKRERLTELILLNREETLATVVHLREVADILEQSIRPRA